MMNVEYPTYGFKLEYFDERAELMRPYILSFRTETGEIEMYDVKNKRTFLRRTLEHKIQLKDLYEGNKIHLNGRQYDVVGYLDEFTTNALSQRLQHTYAMIKPGFSQHMGDAIERIYQEGLLVAKLRFGYMSRSTAEEFYAEHQGKPFYETLMKYITSGPVVAMELVGNNAISKWRQIIGPTNLDTAKAQAPNSLRARFARSTTENFAHGSDAPETAQREIGIIFGQRSIRLCSDIDNCTMCVIKPHAVKSGYAGKIIKMIVEDGFTISGAVMQELDLTTASEFYEVYRGVVDDYLDSVKELTAGPCLALELAKPPYSVQAFRDLCGPRDVPIAKVIAPNSIRGKYGVDLVHNAVHCTDLEDDAQLECEYFFTLLDAA